MLLRGRRMREEKPQQVVGFGTEPRMEPISPVNPQRPISHREMVADSGCYREKQLTKNARD